MVEIYINNTLLDLPEEGVAFPLNYSIADIREPEKRKQSFSKTIVLPSSKTNDKLFTHAFNVNRNGGYNANLKADCLILDNGVQVFQGYARLKKIVQSKTRDFNYEVVVYGKLSNIFFDFAKDKLGSLDFSEFNHEYTKTNQANSWDTSIIENSSAVAFEYGNGYVYPLIDYGYSSNQIDYKVTELYPALYVKEIWDKIFSTYGYTYESNFIDSARFKRLIIPFNRERLELSNKQIEDRLYQASNTAKQEIQCEFGLSTNFNNAETIQFDDDSTGSNFDNGGNYNTVTYSFTVPDTGYYSFVVPIFYGFKLVPDTTATVTPTETSMSMSARLYKNGTATVNSAIGGIYLANVPAFSGTYESANTVAQPDPDGIFTGFQDPNYSNKFILSVTNELLEAGDEITVSFWCSSNLANLASFGVGAFEDSFGNYYDGEYYVQVKANSVFYNKVNNVGLVEGGTVDMNSVLPVDVEIKDFLSSLIKMFNLYIEQDPTNEKNYFIEPRNDFYSNGAVKDIEDLLDNDSQQDIEPMGALDAGRYLWTYKEDKDYYNERYTASWGEIYGEYFKDVNNDFLKNEKKTEVIFSPTPVADTGFSDMVMPRIFQTENNGNIKPYASNIRILYYGGLRNITGQQWNHVGASATTAYNNYPYCGHLDDPFNPTFDLNFGVVKEVYYDDLYTTLNWTDANLYNEYHKKLIEEITDSNSILFTGMYWLRAKDVYDFDFRNNYYFLNAYWRLNKVIDYNPNEYSLTKCEFVKLKDVNAFTATTGEVIGGDTEIGEYTPPKLKTSQNYNNNNYPVLKKDVSVSGEGNFVDPTAKSTSIIGNNNVVGAGAENIRISGNGNNILAGLTDVTLINTDNTDIIESGVTYVNGVELTEEDLENRPRWARIDLTSSEILSLNSTPITCIAAQGAGKIISPIKILIFKSGLTTPYTSNTNIRFTFGDNSTRIYTADGILATAAPYSVEAEPTYLGSRTNFPANTALKVYTDTGNPTAGNGSLTILINYTIYTA